MTKKKKSVNQSISSPSVSPNLNMTIELGKGLFFGIYLKRLTTSRSIFTMASPINFNETWLVQK